MKTVIDDHWKTWLAVNLNTGCDKNSLFRIMWDEGFDYQAIKREMQYEPALPIELIPNPLKVVQQPVTQAVSYGKIDPEQLFIPNAKRLDTDKAELYILDDFMTRDECKKMVALINSRMKPSTLSSYDSDQYFRTSSTCHMGEINSPLMKMVDTRISRIMGIHPSYGEGIQGQHYEVGQEFKAHTDYFEAAEMGRHGGKMGQRTYTFMVYLNDTEEGGETAFLQLGQTFKPKAGTAVIWNNLNPDGTTNYNTLHHAKMVTKGTKTIITKWFRLHSSLDKQPPMYTKEANEYIPNYTKIGFHKCRAPEALFKELRAFYFAHKKDAQDEHVPGDFVYSKKPNGKSSILVDLSPELRDKIHDALKPMLEEWCGEELEKTYVYGIRTYKDKAILKPHRDRLETHIISAIFNVDQEVNQDWPLVIEDNFYREHHVILKPGDLVFYEGARLTHGRPIPFNGKSFSNVFCHFKPKSYQPKNLQG